MFENLFLYIMNKMNREYGKFEIKKLTEFELSQIRGGEWVNVDGEWIWIEDHVIDDIGYPIKSQNYLGDF